MITETRWYGRSLRSRFWKIFSLLISVDLFTYALCNSLTSTTSRASASVFMEFWQGRHDDDFFPRFRSHCFLKLLNIFFLCNSLIEVDKLCGQRDTHFNITSCCKDIGFNLLIWWQRFPKPIWFTIAVDWPLIFITTATDTTSCSSLLLFPFQNAYHYRSLTPNSNPWASRK